MIIKLQYDRKHQSLNMKVENYALFRLHKDYFISSIKILRTKLSQQYVEFFRILKKIDILIYRLNLSHHWRIHSIIFVAQLESCSDSVTNSYKRSHSNDSESVHVENDIDQVKFFEIESLINKRHSAIRESKYLVRWKDWKSQYDEWRNISELHNVMNLINEYENFMKNSVSLSDRIFRTHSIKATSKSSSKTQKTANLMNISSFENIKNQQVDTKILRRSFRLNKDITRT
jgi:hypothetical protein